MELTRRTFIAAAAAAGAAAAAEKTTDGGFAEVSRPGSPRREHPVLPPGAGSDRAFAARCVGCQLCVKACPNKVLRPSKGANRPRPEMGFERGWCRPECVKCGEVCPAGAIRRLKREEKKLVHAGHAVWNRDACIAARDGVRCTVCKRKCPYGAITLVPLDPDDPSGPQVPVVDDVKCVGCGACEHLCPARPMPGMAVQGYVKQTETSPMPATAAKFPENAVWQGLRLA